MTTALTLAALLWLALIALGLWLGATPIRRGDLGAAILVRTIQLYARFAHHLRVEGAENIPDMAGIATGDTQSRGHGTRGKPLIVVANHTAGVDPILIQAALPFEPRWMMAEDMRTPALQSLWDMANIIFVDRDRPDPRALRVALRHLQSGGILGVFPEGYIERPARRLLPFRPGIGLLIRKTGALVLPVVVDDTPPAPTAMASYLRTSRARLRFLPAIDYAPTGLTPEEIAADLHGRFAAATGWPSGTREEGTEAQRHEGTKGGEEEGTAAG